MIFRLNDVGDGCCIQAGFAGTGFSDDMRFHLNIDFGSLTRRRLSAIIKKRPNLKLCEDLLISHYHTDHYNGLCDVKDGEMNIRRLFYPYIPYIPETRIVEHRRTIMKCSLLAAYITLGSASGSPAKDLISLVRQKNKANLPFTCYPLYAGKTVNIGQDQFEVVWPPKCVASLGNDDSLVNGIKAIEEILAANKTLQNAYKQFDRQEVESAVTQYLNEEEFQPTPIQLSLEYNKNDNELKKSIKKLSDKVRNITNRFSIGLYIKDRFLFLGDLEKAEIHNCIQEMKKRHGCNDIHVDTFIAPHHGTHYDSALASVKSKYLMASSGKERIKKFACDYKSGFGLCLSTHLHSDILCVYGSDTAVLNSIMNGQSSNKIKSNYSGTIVFIGGNHD